MCPHGWCCGAHLQPQREAVAAGPVPTGWRLASATVDSAPQAPSLRTGRCRLAWKYSLGMEISCRGACRQACCPAAYRCAAAPGGATGCWAQAVHSCVRPFCCRRSSAAGLAMLSQAFEALQSSPSSRPHCCMCSPPCAVASSCAKPAGRAPATQAATQPDGCGPS